MHLPKTSVKSLEIDVLFLTQCNSNKNNPLIAVAAILKAR